MLSLHEVCEQRKIVLKAPLTVGGEISRINKTDCKKYGLLEGVCFCVRHLQEEKNNKGTMCCFPKYSEEDKCSGRLANCPQRFMSVFESVGSGIGSGKLCEKHLKQADSDERITGNKCYVSPRKVINHLPVSLNSPRSFCC